MKLWTAAEWYVNKTSVRQLKAWFFQLRTLTDISQWVVNEAPKFTFSLIYHWYFMKFISTKQSLQCAWQNLTFNPLKRLYKQTWQKKKQQCHFTLKQIRLPSRPQATFKNMGIAYKSKLRFLRISVTENIKWDAQVKSLSSKVIKYLILLNH